MTAAPYRTRVSTKLVAGGILLVALVLAGLLSSYASSSPDGLTKVAEDKDFARTATTHTSDDSPFAGYGASFLHDARASKGVAGVVGVLVVLVLAGGLTFGLRRLAPARADRPDRPADAPPSAT